MGTEDAPWRRMVQGAGFPGMRDALGCGMPRSHVTRGAPLAPAPARTGAVRPPAPAGGDDGGRLLLDRRGAAAAGAGRAVPGLAGAAGRRHHDPGSAGCLLVVPGAAAGVAALATGHLAAGEGQEDPAGAGRKQQPQLQRRLLPPRDPPCRAGVPVPGVPAAAVPRRLRDLQHQGHLEERSHPRIRGVHRLRHPPLLHPQPGPPPAPLLLLLLRAGGHRGGRLPLHLPDGRALRAPRHPPALHRPHRHLLPPAAGPHPVPAGPHCPDPVCGGHHRLPRRHHAQHLLCQRGPPHRGQPGLLPAPRRLRLLRHPRRPQHHAAAGEPGPQPAPVPAGRREPAPAPPLPPAPPRGPPAPARPPRHPPRLLPPRRLHQEDAGLPGRPPRDVAVPPRPTGSPCCWGAEHSAGIPAEHRDPRLWGLVGMVGCPQDTCDGWAGGSSAPTPRRGRILPQEELCWESWGRGDAPPGVFAMGARQLPIKVPCFYGRLAWSGPRAAPLPPAPFSGVFIMREPGESSPPPRFCRVFPWAVSPPTPRDAPVLGLCLPAGAGSAGGRRRANPCAEAALWVPGAHACAEPPPTHTRLGPWCTRVCRAPAARRLVCVRLQSRCLWASPAHAGAKPPRCPHHPRPRYCP
ncbi:putative solute carrier family 22 member 31 isoform X1 [Chroicocephalus ridibundus]|uniref:putative solute carrier family 22 member 31 isoform X1 n=1 Tax=Chroicocephalus ridibundus TaxID=1192867 RepID=UPI002FDD0D6A